ncbi:MAG TPA: DUF3043 domain-containing protein [Micromonosporaceae bacterium]
MFRRRSTAETEAESASVTTAEPEEVSGSAGAARSRSYTPSKKELGKVTPKRKAGGRVAEPPPANRREALRRARQKQREARAEARAGMMAGKEEYLLPRDKGPERAQVRDIVDARRNLATYFLPGALIVLLGSSQAMPPVVRLTANLLWFLIAAGVVVDSFLLSRKVRRVLTERFPKSTTRPRSHYWYAIMRSLSFRKMRMPAPKVKVGQQV